MANVVVDGQDVEAVYEATREAVVRARRAEGPTLIEAKTYRFEEHNLGLFTPGEPYRSPQEVEEYKTQRDPIVLFRQRLSVEGFNESDFKSIEEEVDNAISEATRFGEESELPDTGSLYEYLYGHPYPLYGDAKGITLK